MRKHLLSILFLSFVLSGFTQKLVKAGMGYSRTSVNTTVFRTNSLVTSGDTQFIAWYDENEYLIIGKRQSGEETWEIKQTPYQGNCQDAHNSISLMVDGEGYLHVSFDHHGNPLNYCRSLSPYSLTLGEKESMMGTEEEDVTYPEFYRLPDGDLLFVYRSGASGRGNLVMNRYRTKLKRWERLHTNLIDGEQERNAYWQLYVDNQGTIHLSWVWRETWMVETNHDLCYARSKDGGVTWEESDGETYELPITAGNSEYAWYIPQESELINQTSMTADHSGNPYIVTYWRDKVSDIPQYRLVYHDGKQWLHQQISERVTPFTLKGGGTKAIPMARPRILIRQQENIRSAIFLFRDIERGNRVSAAITDDLESGTWRTTDLTTFPVGSWEPSVDTERWKEKQQLHIFVQHTSQGDGEQMTDLPPQPVYVLEVECK